MRAKKSKFDPRRVIGGGGSGKGSFFGCAGRKKGGRSKEESF